MANIRVDVNYLINDGSEIVFRSPADCSTITGLIVYYPGEDGDITSKEFALADAHGENVGDIDHLFSEGVVVKVILDVTAEMAYVQNADTNAYIERTFVKTVNDVAPDENGNVLITAAGGEPGKSAYKYAQDGGYTGTEEEFSIKLATEYRPATWTPTAAEVGAAAATHNHDASEINSGTLGVASGGTGKATHTSNAVLTGNSTSAVKNVATASGAFYATKANGAAKFGTLPIAQGGTGATTEADARAALGTNMTLLWENASPASSYAGFTPLSLDLSAYTAILVWYRAYKTDNQYFPCIVPVGVGSGTSNDDIDQVTNCVALANSADKWARRYCFASTTAVTFGAGGHRTSLSNNFTVDSTYMIPVRIYGIR